MRSTLSSSNTPRATRRKGNGTFRMEAMQFFVGSRNYINHTALTVDFRGLTSVAAVTSTVDAGTRQGIQQRVTTELAKLEESGLEWTKRTKLGFE
jgi:hypothetical protein